MTDFSRAVWRKSSRSSDNYGQCVELATAGGVIGVRDSKQGGAGPVLEFSWHEMSTFFRAIKTGGIPRNAFHGSEYART